MENQEQVPVPPKEAPPVGKNYSYIEGKWVLVDNPVAGIVSQ
jgi:hypothetical protein